MSTENSQTPRRNYLGIDVGGTKVQASLVEESGAIISSQRRPTPRDSGSEVVVQAIENIVEAMLAGTGLAGGDLAGIGLAIPGVVDPDKGLVVVTPNMSLSGVAIGPRLEARFHVPVALGNDCNLGALGEAWLGSARTAQSMIAILVGTGVGSGVVRRGRLWRGARESAGEIGHIVMQIGGPQCGCGAFGCLESLASRSAIERDIRAAVDAGRTTILTELLEGDLSVIRSSMLRRAIEADDEVVVEIMRRASDVLGHACLTVRHLLDPEVIVLGGGVIEACSDFMLPIIDRIVAADKLAGAREGRPLLLSALGDDAVVLGAVALARIHAGRDPFDQQYDVRPTYHQVIDAGQGRLMIGGRTFDCDVVLRVDGQPRKRKKAVLKDHLEAGHAVDPRELKRICKGGPEVFFLGTGYSGQVTLPEASRRWLERRLIEYHLLPTAEAVAAYNECDRRKAGLLHVMC